jgi:outer membrane protein TolC
MVSHVGEAYCIARRSARHYRRRIELRRGPGFRRARMSSRYTKERLATRTSSAESHNGRAEHFVNGRDVSAEWWQLFRSPALNSLIRKSLAANPNLQSTIAALRVAKENVYAAQGAYFPSIDGNFNPTRQQLAGPISPTLVSGSTVFNLYTAQVLVSYTFDA